MIRCIRNDYNLDKVENEINRTDSENTLIKERKKHSKSMYIHTTISNKIQYIKYKYNIIISDSLFILFVYSLFFIIILI